MARAGFWIRVAATLIDFVFAFVPLIALYFAIAYTMGGLADDVNPETEARINRIGGTVVSLLALAYTSLEIWKAATPGKMLLKLQIRSADQSPAPLGTLTTRWLIKQSSLIVGLFAALFASRTLEIIELIAFVGILVSFLLVPRRSRRAWHDDASGTAVYGPGREEPHGFEPILTATAAQNPPGPTQAPYPPPPPSSH